MGVAHCNLGEITGIKQGEAHVFLGLPYAEPPVGDLRWQPPQRVQSPNGSFDASQFPNRCPQPPYPEILGNAPYPGELSEDCLYLNIYTPAPDNQIRPVMFWIHGGGYLVGSANDFDASALAVENDVVVVCINYRLGIFGYLNLEEFGTEYKGSANLGCQDQIAALRWVQENIAAFGGDPDNVTIFGESAGGGSVLALLAAPAAEGLFHKAIAQSPGPVTFPPSDGIAKLAAYLSVNREQVLQELRLMDSSRLAEAQLFAALVPASSVDGTVITRPTHVAVRDSVNASVPLILGTTRDEGTLLAPMMVYEAALEELPRNIVSSEDTAGYIKEVESTHQTPVARMEQMVTDMFRSNVLRVAQESLAPAWVYRFDLPSTVEGGTLGATHGSTTALTFNAYGADLEMLCKFHDQEDPIVLALSRTWSALLSRFARCGNPNGSPLPDWQPYESTSRVCLMVDQNTRIESDPDRERRQLFRV